MTDDVNDVRLVLDPNVLVSAAIGSRVARALVGLAATGVYRLVVSSHLLDELASVLARDRFLRWRTREQLDDFVSLVRAIGELHADPVDVPSVTRDPDDDYLIALATATDADLLCSGDRDLLEAETDIRVCAPADLLHQLAHP